MPKESISMLDLHGRFQKLGKNELILDVREPDEFAESHVPRSRNIPHEEVQNHASELKRYDQIYVYCRAGRRAQAAVTALEAQGLRNLVCVSTGGMPDWEAAGFEVQSG